MVNCVVLLDGTKSTIDTKSLVPWEQPSNGQVGGRLYDTPQGRWFLMGPDCQGQEIKPRTAAIQLLTWGYGLPPRLSRALEADQDDQPETKAGLELRFESVGPKECVILRGVSESPIVLGDPVPPLTIPQYNVVKVLCDAAGEPVNLPSLIKKSKHSDARKILRRAMQGHEHWPKVIHIPGKPRRGYRIAPPVA